MYMKTTITITKIMETGIIIKMHSNNRGNRNSGCNNNNNTQSRARCSSPFQNLNNKIMRIFSEKKTQQAFFKTRQEIPTQNGFNRDRGESFHQLTFTIPGR